MSCIYGLGSPEDYIGMLVRVQQGDIVPIPRSSNPERIAQNLDIWNFALTAEEMQRIHGLARPDGRIANPAGRAPAWD